MSQFAFRWPQSGDTSHEMASVDMQVFDRLGDPSGLFAAGSGTHNSITVSLPDEGKPYTGAWVGTTEPQAAAVTELVGEVAMEEANDQWINGPPSV